MTRRTIFKLLLFLLAGAIINVAVAWGCHWVLALLPEKHLRFDNRFPNESEVIWWRMNVPHGFQYEPFVVRTRGCGGATWMHLKGSGNAELNGPPPAWTYVEHVRCGWPMPSFAGSLWQRLVAREGAFTTVQFLTRDGWLLHQNVVTKRNGAPFSKFALLPIGLIWPGFAINTIFYAAVLWGGWVLFAVPGRVRRWRRNKRGQCAPCGYSLTGVAGKVCPECGSVHNVGDTR